MPIVRLHWRISGRIYTARYAEERRDWTSQVPCLRSSRKRHVPSVSSRGVKLRLNPQDLSS